MITLVNKGIGNSLKILSLKEIKDLKVNFNEEEILSFINDINEEEESEKILMNRIHTKIKRMMILILTTIIKILIH